MLKRENLRGKRVTVFGLGLNRGGTGTVEFLLKNGVREVIVTDIKAKEELATSIQRLTDYKNITYVLGQHRPEDFSQTDLVIKNPLIPWTNDYVQLALKNNVPVEMDASLFFQWVSPTVPILGVTGTKGKTTTATLLAHLLETAGKKVVRVGIGQIGVLSELDKVSQDSVIVFELSSWRLSALHRLKQSPHLALVTNIYPDHLNYYKNVALYAADKEAIFAYQKLNDIVILNHDNPLTVAMSEKVKSKLYFFGQEAPQENSAFFRGDQAVFRLEGKEEEVFRFEDLHLLGEHNRENALSAALAARLSGISASQISQGITSFQGIEHRLELVRNLDGVRFVNDSAATIPEAALSALQAFSSGIILIAGGSDKKLSLEDFAQKISERAKTIILLPGTATDKLSPFLKQKNPDREIHTVESMEKAVTVARNVAKPGDTVLLSPGVASFGLFKNEFDRGAQFKQAVAALTETH